MEAKNIFLIIIIIFILIIIISYFYSSSTTLTSLTSGKTAQTIEYTSLSTSESGSSSVNFTYSIWLYIDDWNYRYGEEKVIFKRTFTDENNIVYPCPSMTFGAIENNITTFITTYGTDTDSLTIFPCTINNVPIQKWMNVLISVYNRYLDVYLDGKLVRTCILPGVPKIDSTASIYVTPDGGFSGWTSKFEYYPNSTDPQTAWNIYKAGYGGGSIFGNYGDYTIKISVMEGDVEKKSIEI